MLLRLKRLLKHWRSKVEQLELLYLRRRIMFALMSLPKHPLLYGTVS